MNTPAHWTSFSLKTLALLPLSWLYRLGNWLDRETSKAYLSPIPVVSVGNATVGGTGKTPTTLALAPLLAQLGYTVHILTLGYGGTPAHTAHRVTDADTATTVGDEALLLARATPTWVGRDRLASAYAAQKSGATLALCDDAHQHYRLQKNLSFLVIDGPYGFGNRQLLPAGPLREPLARALLRADAAILIGHDTHQLKDRVNLPVFTAHLCPVAFELPPRLVAFAGIGRPEKFFDTLRQMGGNLVATERFPDHHRYSDADITALLAKAAAHRACLITTEKDAVKLSPAQRAEILVLPVTLRFDAPESVLDFLRTQLTN